MKKLLIAVLCACMICVPALAEEVVRVDVTDIVTSLIALVAGIGAALLGYVWRRWVRPWLQQRQLMDVAEIVVNAVEAILGRGYGAEKWILALQKMAEYGFDVEQTAVEDALNAAWKKLDLSQLMAGEKKPEAEEGADNA